MRDAIIKAKAQVDMIAPRVGGVTASKGRFIPANHMLDGGPSVLFDATALLVAAPAVDDIMNETARSFVADIFQHCKYIGYVDVAKPLLQIAGVADKLDEGFIELPGESRASFVEAAG